MVDERGQQPASKQAELGNEGEIELLDIEEIAIVEKPKMKPQASVARAAPASPSVASPPPSANRVKKHAWYAGYGALSIAVMALVTVLLAGGLTAALHSTMRIAGTEEGPDMRLSVETRIPQTGNQKLAGVQEIAERAKWQGTIGISPPDSQGYLPPQNRTADYSDANKIVVPVSQGRLLKFDEPVEQVFIADPQIADIRVISPLIVYVYGKHLGTTNLLAMSTKSSQTSGEPRLTGSALLSVIADNAPPNEAKAFNSPDTALDLKFVGSRIMLSGRMRNIDDAVNAANIGETYSPAGQVPINNTTLSGSNQVNIRVRFAEMSRNDLKSFGIDWNVNFRGGSLLGGSTVGRSNAADTSNPNLHIGATAGAFNVDVLIDALQSNGALQILAEPNLTALTGETAKFLAGGEVPIPVPSNQINDNNRSGLAGLQYKSFGVALSFTPTLVKENRIALRVQPEVSSITSFTDVGFQGFSFPVFKVSRTETTVEMASGQTFALAGLFQRDISKTVEKMPVLGDVPVLGPLFRSERYKRNETELVILITPYLVNPVREHDLATPVDPVPREDASLKGAGLAGTADDNMSGFIVK